MSLHVLLDVRLLGKGTATRNALEGLLPCVASDMLLKIKVLGEGLVTVGALEFLSFWLPCSWKAMEEKDGQAEVPVEGSWEPLLP